MVGVCPMNRWWVGVLALVGARIFVLPASAEEIYRQTFDRGTKPYVARPFDSAFGDYRAESGQLTLLYTTEHDAPARGFVCEMPKTKAAPKTREIELNFLGGAADMSNSFFVSYAVGAGEGLSLPPLPAGSVYNDRTGYVVRFIRHGDGTNEVKFYRNDTGWIKELKSEWLPANPISTLRRLNIRHASDGIHQIAAEFDTGARFEKIFGFEDETYPPVNAQRGLHIAAKAHVNLAAPLSLSMDTFIVRDSSATTVTAKTPRHKSIHPR